MRLIPATTWERCDDAINFRSGPTTRSTDRGESGVGSDLDRRPGSRWYDVRGLTRGGQEGPGRAEGCGAGRREPQGEGSGRDLRPSSRHRRADDRSCRSAWVPRDTEDSDTLTGGPLGDLRACPEDVV